MSLKVGDKIWTYSCNWTGQPRTCPVCEGKTRLEVRPEGSTVLVDSVPCDYCSRMGSETPGLVRDLWGFAGKAIQVTIESIKTETGQPDEYQYNVHRSSAGGSWSRVDPAKIFDSQEAAQRAADECAQMNQAKAIHDRAGVIAYCRKQAGWSVGYHKARIKEFRENAEYHRKMLNLPIEEFEKHFALDMAKPKKGKRK